MNTQEREHTAAKTSRSEAAPRVSIVVPVYNAAPYLERCIRSVQAQTFTAWELLLVNDGSKDNSEEICRNFAAEEMRIFVFSKENGGVSSARNCGLQHARGTYVAFLDSDDDWEPGFLQTLVTAIEQEKADAALCGYRIQQQDGSWRDIRIRETVCTDARQMGEYFAAQNVALNMLWNKLYVRARITEAGAAFNTAMTLGEDLKFNLAYFSVCQRMVTLAESLYHYRFNGQSSLGNRFIADRFELAKWQYAATRDFVCSRAPEADLFIIRREITTNAYRYLFKLTAYSGMTGREMRRRVSAVLRDPVWQDVFAANRRCNRAMQIFKACVRLRLTLPLLAALRLRGARHHGN